MYTIECPQQYMSVRLYIHHNWHKCFTGATLPKTNAKLVHFGPELHISPILTNDSISMTSFPPLKVASVSYNITIERKWWLEDMKYVIFECWKQYLWMSAALCSMYRAQKPNLGSGKKPSLYYTTYNHREGCMAQCGVCICHIHHIHTASVWALMWFDHGLTTCRSHNARAYS